jgi:hypothetical protein
MRRTTLTLALVFACACGAATGSATPPAPTTAASPVALACTASGDASATWPSPVTSTSPSIVSATVNGDSLRLTFASGTPQFRVQPQSSPAFAMDPSGRQVVLAGAAGVKIVLLGFRGDLANYTGLASMSSSGPMLLQADKIGDFEGVVSFGAGVKAPSCANVTAGPSTLTFHFIPQPGAGA